MKLNSLKFFIIFVLLFSFKAVNAVEVTSCLVSYSGATWKISLIADQIPLKPGSTAKAQIQLTAPMSEPADVTFSVGFGTNLISPSPWYPLGYATEVPVQKTINVPATAGFYNFKYWGDSGDGTGIIRNCGSAVEVAEPIVLAPRVFLSGNPTSVVSGGKTTLTWESLNNYPATECIASSEPSNSQWTGLKPIPINNGDKKTQDITNLTQTTTFKLLCKNSGGSDSLREVTVSVSKPLPPTVTLTTDPLVFSVKKGDSVNLKWTQFGRTPDSCIASSVPANSQWSGNVAIEGSKTISNIQAETTFSIICSNAGGSDESSKLIKITTPILPLAPYVNLVINPTSIETGQSVEVSWFVRRADKCIASGYPGVWEGLKTFTNDNYTKVTINTFKESKTLTLTCENAGGSTSDSENLTVVIPPPKPGVMSLSFSANPTLVKTGGSTLLSWSTINAHTCRISRNYDYGYVDISGQDVKSGTISQGPLNYENYTYVWWLTCKDIIGNSKTVIAEVKNDPGSRPIVEITPVDDKNIPEYWKPYGVESNAFLHYKISKADSCVSSYTYGLFYPLEIRTTQLNLAKNLEMTYFAGRAKWTGDITYNITCSNSRGETKASAVVKVGPNNAPEKPIFMEQKNNPTYNKLYMTEYIFKYPGYWNYYESWNGDYALNIGAYSYDKDKHPVKFSYYLDGLSGQAIDMYNANILPVTPGMESLADISPIPFGYYKITIPKQQIADYNGKRIYVKACDPYDACSINSILLIIPKPFLDIGLRIKDNPLIVKIAAEPGTPTSPLRIKRNTSSGIKTFGIALVPPGDPNATRWIIKVKDKNGVLKPMALRKL